MAKAIAKKEVTREAYETALKGYVQNNNAFAGLAAKRDKRVAAIDEEYAAEFDRMKAEMDEQFEDVHQYCETNRKDIFTEAKSIEEYGAHVGFRDGKDKVIILEGYKEKDIIAIMLKRKTMAGYLKATYTMDKAAIIKAKPKGTDKLGFKVGKEEAFFLEPIKTEVPNEK